MSATEVGRPHRSTMTPTTDTRARRGSTNRDARGSSHTRRARRAWLCETFAADVVLSAVWIPEGAGWTPVVVRAEAVPVVTGYAATVELPTCRCYRCGALLHGDHDGDPDAGLPPVAATVTVDRIKPGGTYARGNIRPACGPCNEKTGGALGAARRAAARP